MTPCKKLSPIAFAQAILEMACDSRKVVGFYPTELIIPTLYITKCFITLKT